MMNQSLSTDRPTERRSKLDEFKGVKTAKFRELNQQNIDDLMYALAIAEALGQAPSTGSGEKKLALRVEDDDLHGNNYLFLDRKEFKKIKDTLVANMLSLNLYYENKGRRPSVKPSVSEGKKRLGLNSFVYCGPAFQAFISRANFGGPISLPDGTSVPVNDVLKAAAKGFVSRSTLDKLITHYIDVNNLHDPKYGNLVVPDVFFTECFGKMKALMYKTLVEGTTKMFNVYQDSSEFSTFDILEKIWSLDQFVQEKKMKIKGEVEAKIMKAARVSSIEALTPEDRNKIQTETERIFESKKFTRAVFPMYFTKNIISLNVASVSEIEDTEGFPDADQIIDYLTENETIRGQMEKEEGLITMYRQKYQEKTKEEKKRLLRQKMQEKLLAKREETKKTRAKVLRSASPSGKGPVAIGKGGSPNRSFNLIRSP